MPIYLPPISRRRFLKASAAAGAAALFGGGCQSRRSGAAAAKSQADRFILLSDTHIDGNPARVARDVNMTDNLRQACAELLESAKSGPRPSAVLVNGDCAFNTGQPADYAAFLRLLDPIRQAGLPVYCGMGNHDHRDHFRAAFATAGRSLSAPVEDRQLMVVESPAADWVILDSLDVTNSTPGVLGDRQLAWLARTLDAPRRAAKAVVVMVHHQPDFQLLPKRATTRTAAPTTQPKVSGLTDTQALLDVLLPRKQVKALLFGHTHNWSSYKLDDLHMVNLPTTAYVFDKARPSGWVDCHFSPDAVTLQLHALDKTHGQNGERLELKFRA
jgi:3',5'-cyclic AMP phosphodiesterase CpdA